MNIKKILVAVLAVMMVFGNVSFAAKGGARTPAVKSPSVSAPSPSASVKSQSGTEKTYKPSKNAASLDDKGAAAKNPVNTAASSPWGSMLRNVGIFAGGMFLGGMLANLFGMGGFMSDLLGMAANAAIFAVVLIAAISLWRKITKTAGKKRDEAGAYRHREAPEIIDIKPSGSNRYESRSKADEYRRK